MTGPLTGPLTAPQTTPQTAPLAAPPTALVTGANGLLGSALAARLALSWPGEVRCLVRSSSVLARLEPTLLAHPDKVRLVMGSLATVEACAPLAVGVDVVFHLAAALRGAPPDLVRDSVVATRNLLEAIALCAAPPRVVLASSLAVYGTSRLARGGVIDEGSPIEACPERRDAYCFAKVRQERLAWEYRRRKGVRLCVARPGVVYASGVSPLVGRVGLGVPGMFVVLGGRAAVPLTHVDNCAEALALLGARDGVEGRAFNVVDDELPETRELVQQFEREVGPLRHIALPYWATLGAAHLIARYAESSHGQLPAFLTPYRVAATYRGFRYDNARMKGLGWRPRVATKDGLREALASLRHR